MTLHQDPSHAWDEYSHTQEQREELRWKYSRCERCSGFLTRKESWHEPIIVPARTTHDLAGREYTFPEHIIPGYRAVKRCHRCGHLNIYNFPEEAYSPDDSQDDSPEKST